MSGRVGNKHNIPLEIYKTMNKSTARKELQQLLIENINIQTNHVRRHNELLHMYKEINTDNDSDSDTSDESDSDIDSITSESECESDSDIDSIISESESECELEKIKPSQFQKFIRTCTLQLRKERPNLKASEYMKLANIEWKNKHNLNIESSSDSDCIFDSDSDESVEGNAPIDDFETVLLNSVQYKKFVSEKLSEFKKRQPTLIMSKQMSIINEKWNESPYVKFCKNMLLQIRRTHPRLEYSDCYKIINSKWEKIKNTNTHLTPYKIFAKNTMPKLIHDYPNVTNSQRMEMLDVIWFATKNLNPRQKFDMEELVQLQKNYPYLKTADYNKMLNILWTSRQKII